MVTEAPGRPVLALSPAMTRGIVKATLLLATPATVITTLPVEALAGTTATMEPEYQLVIEAGAPLKVTVLVP
jgi:hypothetical protein